MRPLGHNFHEIGAVIRDDFKKVMATEFDPEFRVNNVVQSL